MAFSVQTCFSPGPFCLWDVAVYLSQTTGLALNNHPLSSTFTFSTSSFTSQPSSSSLGFLVVSHCSLSSFAERPLQSLTFPLETHSDTQRLSTIPLPTRSHMRRLLDSGSAITQPLRLPALCCAPSNQAHPALGCHTCSPFCHMCPFSLSSTRLAYLIVRVSEAIPPQTDRHRSAHVPLCHLDTLSLWTYWFSCGSLLTRWSGDLASPVPCCAATS